MDVAKRGSHATSDKWPAPISIGRTHRLGRVAVNVKRNGSGRKPKSRHRERPVEHTRIPPKIKHRRIEPCSRGKHGWLAIDFEIKTRLAKLERHVLQPFVTLRSRAASNIDV